MDERSDRRASLGNGNPPPRDSAKKKQITPPSISLPKGAGAIRGMGEKFAANPVTNTGSMTVAIATSPGRFGFGPQLSLSYDSGSGNGSFGFGGGNYKRGDSERTCVDLLNHPAAKNTGESNVSFPIRLLPGWDARSLSLRLTHSSAGVSGPSAQVGTFLFFFSPGLCTRAQGLNRETRVCFSAREMTRNF
jgi:Salmonella virulence plasmid 65kDa B protein